DGNGRWAKERGKERTFGHQNGRRPVRESVEASIDLGVRYLTLYTFSTENWKRPKVEVSMLLELLSSTLKGEIRELIAQGVRFNVIGEWEKLP
ncbi:MAG: UDP pyrophosphate synthase, partial [Candidatus [Bacteroides] periocalifornicus]